MQCDCCIAHSECWHQMGLLDDNHCTWCVAKCSEVVVEETRAAWLLRNEDDKR